MDWSLVLQGVALLLTSGVIAYLSALLDYGQTDRRTTTFRHRRAYLYIAIFIGLIVNVFLAVMADQAHQREISDLNRKLNAISGYMTGERSICLVLFRIPINRTNIVVAELYNNGDYPVDEIEMHMTDLNKISALSGPTPQEEIDKTVTSLYLDTLGPHRFKQITIIETPLQEDTYGFNVRILTRYKEYEQKARFRRVDDRWYQATRVVEKTSEDNILVFEYTDAQFFQASPEEPNWHFSPPSTRSPLSSTLSSPAILF